MEAFVYIWINLTDSRNYIGYHKGTDDDGYICSSHSSEFWNDFNSNKKWARKIIFRGSMNECLEYEQNLLDYIDIKSNEWYNNGRGKKIIWTDEIRQKQSNSIKKRWSRVDKKERIELTKKWREGSKKWYNNLSDDELQTIKKEKSEKTRKYWNNLSDTERQELIDRQAEGHKGLNYHSEEYKQKLSERMIGNDFGKYQTQESRDKKRKIFLGKNNPGKYKSDITRKRISESKKGIPSPMKGKKRKTLVCPHCGKIGGDGIMQRWHFDNCKTLKK